MIFFLLSNFSFKIYALDNKNKAAFYCCAMLVIGTLTHHGQPLAPPQQGVFLMWSIPIAKPVPDPPITSLCLFNCLSSSFCGRGHYFCFLWQWLGRVVSCDEGALNSWSAIGIKACSFTLKGKMVSVRYRFNEYRRLRPICDYAPIDYSSLKCCREQRLAGLLWSALSVKCKLGGPASCISNVLFLLCPTTCPISEVIQLSEISFSKRY